MISKITIKINASIVSTIFIVSLIIMICSSKSKSIRPLASDWHKLFQPLKFGSNKPHLMFHLGTRDLISYNIGYGYWLVKPSQPSSSSSSDSEFLMYSDLRYRYQNTQNSLYINMLNHDGERIIEQQIKDNRYKINSQIKYMYTKDEQNNFFESEIQIQQFNQDNSNKQNQNNIFSYKQQNQKNKIQYKQFENGDVLWFLNIAIENSDLKLINHKDHFSPLCFKTEKITKSQIKLNLLQFQQQKDGKYDFNVKQTLTIKTINSDSIKMFGFTLNITESYQATNYIEQFQHLLQLERYPHLNIPRKNDSKIIQWEDKQIEQIKNNQFKNRYTYIIVYGTVSRNKLLTDTTKKQKIYFTNSTEKKRQEGMDNKKFEILRFENRQQLFKNSLAMVQDQSQKRFIQHVIFNLLGGLTYYEGKLYTQNSIMSHQHDYSFGFTPSRLIFPRSFLWDDGFHMSVVTKMKPDLVMKILHNWLKKVDTFGWIGREQIRGFEMGSLMPDSRFIFQDIFELNPPTIVIPILKLIQHQTNLQNQTKQNLNLLLTQHFPSLEKHFRYFTKTQSHFDLTYKEDLQKTIKYRWKCKDQCDKGNFMGSGLDDYPRVENKSQISKQHIDLTSWLWLFSDSLQQIASYLQNSKAEKYYSKWKLELRQKIIQECLDEADMLFKDLAVKNNKVYIDQKVTKIGYINLFPFFVGLLQLKQNESQKRVERILNVLSKTIDIMMDEKQLMSKGGIRSLSLNDSDYATEQNYWRGAVWMPINYMILRACKKYYWDIKSLPHREKIHSLYNELRKRLISTVRANYEKSGYLFQNYIEGEGNRGYPFYGWTSLIASIILEDY